MKTAKRFAMLAGLALALMAVISFAGCNGKDEIAKAIASLPTASNMPI